MALKPVMRWDAGAQKWANVKQANGRPKKRRVATGRMLARQFQAAQTDRLTHAWPTVPIPADDIVRRTQRTLVARSREQIANNDYAVSFRRKLVQNVIGHRGFMLQAQAQDADGSLDTAANQGHENAWAAWGHRENCDITGGQSFRLICVSVLQSACDNGEFFVRIIAGATAGPWGFALQVLDPQRCPVDFDQDKLGGGEYIRQGIRFNAIGKPVAYLFGTLDPREADYHYGGRHFVAVPAGEIIHGFRPDMIGQKRGIPWLATALWRMNMQKGFGDAALVNARASAAKGGWLEWDENAGPSPEENEDPEAEHEELHMEGEPGVWQELPPGLRARSSDLNFPAGEFAIFDKQMLRGMSAGLGVGYESFANDRENVNFSSIRQGTLDERENWKELQEWFIEAFVQPVHEAWLPRALLAGRIMAAGQPLPAAKRWKYQNVLWQPRRWQWVDPDKDSKAAERQKNNLLTHPGQIIREQGADPDTVWRNWAQDIKAMRAAGIPDDYINAAIFGAAAPVGGSDESGKDGPEGAASE